MVVAGLRMAKQGASETGGNTLKPLPGFWKLGRDDRKRSARLGPNMTRDQADDPLGFLRRQHHAGVGAPRPVPVEPQPAVRIDDHLDDIGLFEGEAIAGPIAVRNMPRRRSAGLGRERSDMADLLSPCRRRPRRLARRLLARGIWRRDLPCRPRGEPLLEVPQEEIRI